MSGTEKRATTAPQPGKPGSHTKAPRDVSEGAAVSMPKTAPRAAQGINFGTVDDQNAVMSSSPAAQPTTGEHLRGGNLGSRLALYVRLLGDSFGVGPAMSSA